MKTCSKVKFKELPSNALKLQNLIGFSKVIGYKTWSKVEFSKIALELVKQQSKQKLILFWSEY